ncbi:MAG: M23 family metallopeptidase [Acidobacteria bacterium]|nr:MAG: M23 family metallopeptidase [Acidobacteriota bacterium]
MGEESKNERRNSTLPGWNVILGEGFGEHAQKILLIGAVALIWIVFSPQPAQPAVTPNETPSEQAEQARSTPADRFLLFPVKGVGPGELQDSFDEKREGGRRHQAIDIMAERRAPVVAVEDGTVAKIESSRLGGLAVYQYDSSATQVFYYAHLDGYAPGLREGSLLRQGDLIGYVGQTGNAQTPHLHFAISRLKPGDKWWGGQAINPYPLLRQAAGMAAGFRYTF